MKHWYYTLIACLLALTSQAQSAQFGLTVVSQQTGAPNGQLSFQLLAVAQEAGPAAYSVQLESPTFALGSNPAARSAALIAPSVRLGDTVRTTVAVQYDLNRLPFSLEKMEVKLVDPAGNLVGTAPAFVFFTPYNTVELWNRTDLDKLNRVWDVPNSGSVPARQYVNPSTIPASDLTDEELANPNVPQKLKSIAGLAYAIPMKDTGQDAEETAGDFGAQTQLFDRHNWNATVTGRVLTSQWNGRSRTTKAPFPLAVTGIRVELMDKDGLWDDFLGSAHTDDDGRFSITFSNTQGSEGSYLDLYVNIVATTAGGTGSSSASGLRAAAATAGATPRTCTTIPVFLIWAMSAPTTTT